VGERAKRRTAVYAATAVLVLSMVLPVAAGAFSAAATSTAPMAAHAASGAGATVQQTTAPAVPAGGVSGQIAQTPTSPHAGTIDVYEIAPAGSNTEDPSVAYDTVSYEPILNVYQTLINYDGNSTTSFVPTLAVCVPGTVQCTTDFGSNLTGYVPHVPAPVYWTFVIDKQANFYDPTTSTSWPVYPADVVFSLARTMAFADTPYAGKQPGWIQTQALVQYGDPGWDNGIHFPYNNTPSSVLSSMLVNDSTYCPASAMSLEHGCVTFIANGGGADWPYFMELVADNLGASIEPCGWFNYEHAAMPGWGNTNHHVSHGDGTCTLPGGLTSTNGPAWASYLAGLSPYGWDAFENLTATTPVVNPGVQWNMVGSGPYYAGVIPGSAYSLRANPAYNQPSGCSGVGGMATYGGYCDPAAGAYQPNVNVYWEPDDSFGISQYRAHQADFAGIETTHTTTLLLLASEGDLNYYTTPTISDFFTPINLGWSNSEFTSQFPTQPIPNVPSDFFTNLALREFYVHSYPYTTVENTVRTVDGIQYDFNVGGPIPFGMGNYYPTNVSYPTGDPDTNPSDVGGAAWWWAQATNIHSPWYDAQLAACTPGTPCTWAIAGLQGDPGDDIGIADWITEIKTLTGNALQPYGGASFDLTFDQFLDVAFTSAYDNPLVSEVGTGWAPDYPDPTDYVAPEASPNNVYTEADAFAQQLGVDNPAGWAANNTTCGHSTVNTADLVYWAHAADNIAGGGLAGVCQNVAYGVAVAYMNIAAALPVSAERTLDYNLITHITNGLSMAVWNGQANTVASAAPWIDGSSINSNVMIGGGGDQIWYQIKYAPFEQPVTFKESGLPLGASFTVHAGSPVTAKTSANVTSHGASVAFNSPLGTLSFTITPPAGYGVAQVVGPHGTTYTTAPVTAATTLTVKFGLLENLYFNESISLPHWPGLPAGTNWSVTLTPSGNGGPPGMVGTNTTTVSGGSIHFVVPKGAHYKWTTQKPASFKDSGAKKGGFGMAPHAVTKLIKFAVNGANIVFAEHGLAAHTSWSVSVTGPSPSVTVTTVTSSTGTAKFYLANGSYTYSIPVVGSDTPTPASGALVVVAPHAQTIHVGFAASHAQFGTALVTRQSTTLSNHANLVATVSGREAA